MVGIAMLCFDMVVSITVWIRPEHLPDYVESLSYYMER